MITHYPVLGAPAATADPARRRRAAHAPSCWKYGEGRRTRWPTIAAGVASAGLHLGLLFGIDRAPPKAVATAADEPFLALSLVPPQILELEEPESVPSDDTAPPTDLATLVPMQADLPQLPRPNDFVQAVNFTSLIEAPDFSNLHVTVIPETFRGGRKLAESVGKIFNLSDLDRHPEPLIQPAPLYPLAMKREAYTGTVSVEFVVDATGTVVDAVVVQSTNPGFNEAALAGVMKWRFRPGVRDGRKVSTRMRVPIAFSLSDPE